MTREPYRRIRVWGAFIGCVLLLVGAHGFAAPTTAKDFQGLPYAGAHSAPDQKLDLHLPRQAADGRPVLVFVPGGFWAKDSRFALPTTAAAALTEHGMAVAVIHTRAAPEHRHPAQVGDVASAVAWLLEHAEQYGYSAKRLYLAGHSSGAQLASLAALDPRYLQAHSHQPDELAGVIVISGIFDVSARGIHSAPQRELYQRAFGADYAVRRAASPVEHIHANAPSFLVLSAADDLSGIAVASRRFAQRLRGAGDQQSYFHPLSHNNRLSMIDFAGAGAGAPALRYILAFTGVDRGGDFFASRDAARHLWESPPISTEPFWKNPSLVQSYPVDRGLVTRLVGLMQGNAYMLSAWPLQRYHAIPLQDWLQAQNPDVVGHGDWLVTTNLRGEKLYFKLSDLLAYDPVIVVGLDDERNLFRLAVFYQAKQEYSWIDDGPRPPLMVRPLGAFYTYASRYRSACARTFSRTTASLWRVST